MKLSSRLRRGQYDGSDVESEIRNIYSDAKKREDKKRTDKSFNTAFKEAFILPGEGDAGGDGGGKQMQ